MKAIEFPQQTIILAKDQPEYTPLPVHVNESENIEATAVFELNDEDIQRITSSRKLYFSQCTFGSGFKPILVTAYKQDSPIPMIGEDWLATMDISIQEAFLHDCSKRWNESLQAVRRAIGRQEFKTFKSFIIDGLGLQKLSGVQDGEWDKGSLAWVELSKKLPPKI